MSGHREPVTETHLIGWESAAVLTDHLVKEHGFLPHRNEPSESIMEGIVRQHNAAHAPRVRVIDRHEPGVERWELANESDVKGVHEIPQGLWQIYQGAIESAEKVAAIIDEFVTLLDDES